MENKLEQQPSKTEALDMYGTDLTKMATEGKMDPLIGRQKQIDRVVQILCKKEKNNACLVGNPGVGKTVIAEGLALRISNATVPETLLNKKVISIDTERLTAGTYNRNDITERLSDIVNEVEASNDAIILFIDELPTLIGRGQTNILKMKCIVAATQDEYREYIEDSVLKRRYSLVDVPEATVEETLEILQRLRKRYENYHNVEYTESALAAAARLSKRYISDEFLPDKAIDLIDEAGARLQNLRIKGSSETLVVMETEIQQQISVMTGIPVDNFLTGKSTQLLKMEEILSRHIIGQEEAVSAVSRAIRRAGVGLRNPNRPIASFLFVGPTGVGKTELAKLLAAEYFGSKENMARFDMSEYMEGHAVSRLFGSPPGYVGYDDEGQLTNAVRQRPHSLVLFDEIEKAHPDVFNTFLQILEDGRLTDSKGRTVDFNNTIIIMTSNVGGHLTGASDSVKKLVDEELKKLFKPEFLNRIDEVVVFGRLKRSHMEAVLKLMLKEVNARLEEKKVDLVVSNDLKEKLLEEGYNPVYGARPMRRAITRLIEDKIAETMLTCTVKEGCQLFMAINHCGEVTIKQQ